MKATQRVVVTGVCGVLLVSVSLVCAQHLQDARRDESAARNELGLRGGAPHREPVHGVQARPAGVERVNHGTIRHLDEHFMERPLEVRHETEIRQNVTRHHDVEVDMAHARYWHGFVFGQRHRELRAGCRRLQVRGAIFFYDSGLYYQPVADGYQEVFPPVGAELPDLPEGAIAIEAGNTVYYYAGGAFYVQQEGGFVIAPPPLGVTVPELPPGAILVSIRGSVAYQFNGIYYQPVFVNGVTQYQTFMP